MLKSTLFLLAGLVVGLATASLWPRDVVEIAPAGAEGAGDITARVAALEAALGREAQRRAELETQIDALRAELTERPALAAASASEPTPREAVVRREEPVALGAEPGALPVFTPGADLDARRRGRVDLESRLVEAGFSADRAAYINARSEALRMQALQAQYEARRDGVPLDARALGVDALRDELGEAEYERYLEAMGRSTSVRVGGVLASSPAEQSGLLPGDEVVAYAGRRVFDMRDLNALILEGRPGEVVTVDVLRDGQPMQVVMPRGPLGITGRGRR